MFCDPFADDQDNDITPAQELAKPFLTQAEVPRGIAAAISPMQLAAASKRPIATHTSPATSSLTPVQAVMDRSVVIDRKRIADLADEFNQSSDRVKVVLEEITMGASQKTLDTLLAESMQVYHDAVDDGTPVRKPWGFFKGVLKNKVKDAHDAALKKARTTVHAVAHESIAHHFPLIGLHERQTGFDTCPDRQARFESVMSELYPDHTGGFEFLVAAKKARAKVEAFAAWLKEIK